MLQRRTKGALGRQDWKSDCFAASHSSFGSDKLNASWASISSPAKHSSWNFIKNSSLISLYCTHLNLCLLLNSWKYLASFWIYLHDIYVLYIKTPILWPPDAKSWLIGTDADAGKDWRQEEKETTADEMVGWHLMDVSLSKSRKMVKDREAWHSPVHGVAKSWTRLSGWTTTTMYVIYGNSTTNS